MRCAIHIEDDHNVICKDVSTAEGDYNAMYYDREDMIEAFLTALQGMGYSFGTWDSFSLAKQIEHLIWESGPEDKT